MRLCNKEMRGKLQDIQISCFVHGELGFQWRQNSGLVIFQIFGKMNP